AGGHAGGGVLLGCRGPQRKPGQALRRREGQRQPDSRPWRRARSFRQPAGRGAHPDARRRAAAGAAHMSQPAGVAVLGSTGSIGESTLDVLRRHPGAYRVVALLAHTNVARLIEQAREFRPAFVAIADAGLAAGLRARLQQEGITAEVLEGPEAAAQLALLDEVHCVVAAIVGAAGLASTPAAAGAGKR